MSDEKQVKEKGRQMFNHSKGKIDWERWVRESKSWLFKEKQARYVIETNPEKRKILQEAEVPYVTDQAEIAAPGSRDNHKRKIFDKQLFVFHHLEKNFLETNPTLFDKVELAETNFATKLFALLEEEWKPSGYGDADIL
eukprot:1502730-Rhodomonas_salina.2